jgi:hypothetical protein
MSQAETQLVVVIRQLVAAVSSIGSRTAQSPLDVWGPPIAGSVISVLIAIFGWMLIDGSNQKNNRESLRLQTEELARNRVLDVLDEYYEYLFDVEDLRRILFENNGLRSKEPMGLSADGVPNSGLVVDVAILEQTITTLALLDSRQFHWINTIGRDSWLFDPKSDTKERFQNCLHRHKAIMDNLFIYTEQLRYGIREGNAYLARRLEAGRDSAAKQQIAEQRAETMTIYATLTRPRFLPPEQTLSSPSKDRHDRLPN